MFDCLRQVSHTALWVTLLLHRLAIDGLRHFDDEVRHEGHLE